MEVQKQQLGAISHVTTRHLGACKSLFFFIVQFPITFSLDHLTLHGQDTIACSAAISACEKAAQWEVALQLLGNTRATWWGWRPNIRCGA